MSSLKDNNQAFDPQPFQRHPYELHPQQSGYPASHGTPGYTPGPQMGQAGSTPQGAQIPEFASENGFPTVEFASQSQNYEYPQIYSGETIKHDGQPPPYSQVSPAGYPPKELEMTKRQVFSQPGIPETVPVPLGFAPNDNDRVILVDEEGNQLYPFDFSEQIIRKTFIKKVYAILMVQLAVTFSFVAVFVYSEPVKYWVRARGGLTIIGIIGLIVGIACVFSISFFESVRRNFPTNFIVLSLFTIAESLLLGAVTSLIDSETVMMAVGITAAICLSLTLFAFQTKWDFTGLGAGLWCCLVVLILFGLIASITRSNFLQTTYAALGALLFSFYLIYDTQLIMGGQHKFTISPEDYIYAALILYLDIINLFIKILRLLKSR